MSLYVMVLYSAMGVGSLLLCVTDPESSNLFILASVLISFGIIPILMSTAPGPSVEASRRLGLVKLFRKAPLGVGVMFLTGVSQGTLLGAGPIYADKSELTTIGIAAFRAIIYLASLVFMVPLGHLADRFDRGRFIATMSSICVVLAILMALTPPEYEILLYCLIAPFSGICLAHYGFGLAAINDALEPKEMVGAGATMFMFSSASMALGPVIATEMIEAWRPPSFFICLAVVHRLIVMYTLSFSISRRGAPVHRRRSPTPFVSSLQGPLATSIALEDEILQRQPAD